MIVFRLFDRFCSVMHGEKLKDVLSLCYVDYANYLHDKNNVDRASVFYDKAITLNSKNHYAYGGLSAVLIDKQQFEQALKVCNKALSIKEDVQTLLLQSIIYMALGNSRSSQEAFDKTLAFFNNDLSAAYDRLAYTYVGFNMNGEAETYLKEAIKINPREAGLHFNLAQVYYATEQLGMAAEEFRKVLELTNNRKYKKYSKKIISKMEKEKND